MKKITFHKTFLYFFVLFLPFTAISQNKQDTISTVRIVALEKQIKELQTINNHYEVEIEKQFKDLESKYSYLNLYLLIATIFVTSLGFVLSLILYSRQKSLDKDQTKWENNAKDIEQQAKNIINKIKTEQEQRGILFEFQDIPDPEDGLKKIEEIKQQYKDKIPNYINTWGKALIKFSNEDYAGAEQTFLQLLNNDIKRIDFKNLSNIYRCLSVCYSELNRPNMALVYAESAVTLRPDNSRAWNNKGIALDRLGQKKEALKCFDMSIEIFPNYANVWYNRGSVLVELGKKEKEILESLNKSIELNSTYALPLVLKGCILHSQEAKISKQCFMKIKSENVTKTDLKEIKRVFYKYQLQDKYIEIFG